MIISIDFPRTLPLVGTAGARCTKTVLDPKTEIGRYAALGVSCEIVVRDGEQITVYGSIMGTLQDMKDMTALIAGAGIARTNSAANSERPSLHLSGPQGPGDAT